MSNRPARRGFSDPEAPPALWSRKLAFFLVFLLGMGILGVRLFVLMIIQGGRYKALAQENRTRETIIPAPRGILYDRNGNPLVRNMPAFLGPDHQVAFEKPPSDGSHWVEGVARDYIYGPAFAHVIGYVGEVNDSDLKTQGTVYKSGDIIGKMGVEQTKDTLLRGVDGKELIETDALGERVRTLGTVRPLPGANMTLTLDRDLQQAAREALGDNRGAIIASVPQTGEVLTLYSSPSFDPNDFVRGTTEGVLERTDQPLFNRAISGQYPPGSTFKLITAVAGLESKKIFSDTIIEDTGIVRVGAFSFGNWYFSQYGKVEGPLNIVGALRRSNDIFFYKAAETTGIDTIAGWARAFGLGKPLGIDVLGEETGLMPDPTWTQQVKKEPWYLGNTYHVAIGQGDVLATPLQVNSWANIIATGGKLCRPHVIEGQISNLKSQRDCEDLEISQQTITLVREGMKEACSPGGTGWPLFNFKVNNKKLAVDHLDYMEATQSANPEEHWVEIPVACKTGTAEFGDPKGKTHAWFTAYAPVVHPQISVTVLVEEGGEGSTNAGPLAKKIFEAWFER